MIIINFLILFLSFLLIFSIVGLLIGIYNLSIKKYFDYKQNKAFRKKLYERFKRK